MLDLVSREDLPSAVALNSAHSTCRASLDRRSADCCSASSGSRGAISFNSASFLAVIAALWFADAAVERAGRPRRARDLASTGRRDSLRPQAAPRASAARRRHGDQRRGGRTLLFLPVFARDVLDREAEGLARLWAAMGVGALAERAGDGVSLSNSAGRGRLLLAGSVCSSGWRCGVRAVAQLSLSCIFLALVGRRNGQHYDHGQHAVPDAGAGRDARPRHEHVRARLSSASRRSEAC